MRYRNTTFKVMLVLFLVSFIGLGILGALVADDLRTSFARAFSGFYFLFFLGMPLYTVSGWMKDQKNLLVFLARIATYASLLAICAILLYTIGGFEPRTWKFGDWLVKGFILLYTVFFAATPFLDKWNRDLEVPTRVTMGTAKQKILFFVYTAITLIGAYLFAVNV